jgi:uncharacterized protein HemX
MGSCLGLAFEVLPAVITAVLAVLAIRVTFYPPQTDGQKRAWLVCFALLATLGVGATIYQSVQTRRSQERADMREAKWRRHLKAAHEAQTQALHEIATQFARFETACREGAPSTVLASLAADVRTALEVRESIHIHDEVEIRLFMAPDPSPTEVPSHQ